MGTDKQPRVATARPGDRPAERRSARPGAVAGALPGVRAVRVAEPAVVAQSRLRHDRPVAAVLQGSRAVVRDGRPSPWRPHPVTAAGWVLVGVAALLGMLPGPVLAVGALMLAALGAVVAVDRGRGIAEELAREPSVEQRACAIADALQASGLLPRGAAGVRVVVDARGIRRCWFSSADPDLQQLFADAFAEVVAPPAHSRYLVPRWRFTGAVDNADGLRVLCGRVLPDSLVWQPVPTVLGASPERAHAFARAWDHWVGGGAPVRSLDTEVLLAPY